MEWNDDRVDQTIGTLLRAGVILAAAVVLRVKGGRASVKKRSIWMVASHTAAGRSVTT